MASAQTTSNAPRRWLQVGSVLLPIVKCLVCPLCLGLFGTALAEVSANHMFDERLHRALCAFAVIAGLVILAPSFRHHLRPEPLALWAAGSALAVSGHVFEVQAQESLGFALLMAGSLANLVLLRRCADVTLACCDASEP